MPNGVIAHEPSATFDLDTLKARGQGLAGPASAWTWCRRSRRARATPGTRPRWAWGKGYGRQDEPELHVVAIDYGLKRNILRCLATAGCEVTVVPATASAEEILERKPDGVFLSNGPGDPAATGEYAVPEIKKLVDSGLPVFGICLGHQMLGLALGATTNKMHQGHHGANHPVKDFTTGKVEITSMNHGFAVDRDTLPADAEETHVLPVRRLQLRAAPQGQAGVLGAVPPRGLARPRGQPLPLHPLRQPDAASGRDCLQSRNGLHLRGR